MSVPIIILTILILGVAGGVVYVYMDYSNSSDIPPSYVNVNTSNVGTEQISYLLYQLEANKLHNAFFSSDTPKLEIMIGSEVYNSEVVKGKITTKIGSIEDKDLQIIMFKEDFLAIIKGNINEKLKESVSNNRTKIIVSASKIKLAGKGYLELYEKFS